MKENGFAIGLLAATVVVGGGLVAFGVAQGKKYGESLSTYEETKSEVSQMVASRPFPSQDNVDERKTVVTGLRGKVEGLQKALLNYRPEELEAITSNEFQNRLVTATTEMTDLFKSKNIAYPEQFAFGMEQYTDSLANPQATGELDYELKAFTWMFKELATNQTYTIKNFRREGIPSERGENWIDLIPRGEDVPVAQSLPFEVTFLAQERFADEFINKLTSNGQYFYAIDAVKIVAEVQEAPTRAMSGLEEEAAAEEDSGGGDFAGAFAAFDDAGDDADADEEAGDEAAADEAVEEVDTGRILGQIAGPGKVGDGVWVAIQGRVLLFTDTVTIPEIN